MRLAHHPEAVDRLRAPTDEDPWRVLVSGCIAGWPCGVDGTSYRMETARPDWPRIAWVPVCPELVGLGVPRPMPDLHGGDGHDALDGRARVLAPDGTDLTEGMIAGGREAVRVALEHRVDWALLTDFSAACGTQVVSLGARSADPRRYQRGVGVAAALLLRAGIPVVSQRDFATLQRLRARVDPSFVPDPAALDHHDHPWVREHLPG
jgi:uncharacterized protein YbbK (DUF523 family)